LDKTSNYAESQFYEVQELVYAESSSLDAVIP